MYDTPYTIAFSILLRIVGGETDFSILTPATTRPFSILLRIVGGETRNSRKQRLSPLKLSVSSCGSWGVKPYRPPMQRLLTAAFFQYPLADRGG